MTAPAPDFLPFVRPEIDAAAIADVGKVLASGWITSGPKMQAFEAALSDLFGGRPVRTFANGSATMEIALRIADIGPGDEVITTPVTWVATANVVIAVGARPVFVDIDPRTRNLDLDAVEAAITPRTRAIMPVYLSGLPVDMDRLYAMAAKHGLRVIEDAAQAIDSRWQGQRIGAFGDLVSFSFQANKNITTIEGGCLVMNTPEEAVRAERLRLQGVIRTGMDGMDVEEPGGKFNLTDVNAAVGLAQLDKLDAITARRAELAETYFRCAADHWLAGLGIELPLPLDAQAATTNWHMFQVVLPTGRLQGGPAQARQQVMEAMRERGIGTGVHYPPIHLFTYYRSLGWREGMLPHAERIGRGIVTLPLFPAMQATDVERVCATLSETCKRLSK
ncbi:DegT/DnrJ/EryC1/StrS family aminotransferase [Cupriavidus oxalaticus]|uniref:DegT/DnrJ/EryC1/StrS aminotransferase family protein n=1 Tax=Cupriavidus oxalaticus TaxID=96344 RepID=A0A5P3VAJ7_9BURK|nr:DegT/DnrJ/EryC1/StrS aminotransferase family protein [Cupriavidus oxalaticus]QEZ43290.1 DegT/DnrJ/EryC1/StrS aminotransferase family protein [Cupriavidus oxalaticus]